MFSRFHRTIKIGLIPIGTAVVSIGVYQGISIRQKYRSSPKLEVPTGPNFGFAKFVEKLKDVQKDLVEKLSDKSKIGRIIKGSRSSLDSYVGNEKVINATVDNETTQESRNSSDESDTLWKKAIINVESLVDKNIAALKESSLGSFTKKSDSTRKRRKIKLLVIGDSLVSGVGCDGTDSSPVLPKILAELLSTFLRADVIWESAGIVGGTVSDLRESLLPQIKEKMDRTKLEATANDSFNDQLEVNNNQIEKENKTEMIVVVICGLNDFKVTFESFPPVFGPSHFKSELEKFVSEIKEIASSRYNCSVFLPALPITFSQIDPNCSFGIAPLNYLISGISWIWDSQKQAIAMDDLKVKAEKISWKYSN